VIRRRSAFAAKLSAVKLLRYGPVGAERPAVLVEDGGVVDVGDVVGDFDQRFFAGGGIDRLNQVFAEDLRLDPVDLEGERIGAPIAKPYQVLGIGLNYADHAAETGAALPSEPVVFNKAPSSVVGPNDDVLLPPGSTHTDWEVELAVVIGSTGRYLADEQAARACIAGYAISNDVSERHFQKDRGGQWVKGKSFETFNPLGPWLVTPDEAGDIGNLALRLDVNGERMQDSSTASMIFGVYHLVWYLSQFLVLEPGDLINTGTPAGVGLGRRPPRFLADGDVMELSVEGLGTQRQQVRNSPG
jgi:2-keto-4-pentenoate hydratase/2-oxohepta-3-ene-1,7-dioic acid hydratase in catechol pathway